MTDTKRKPAILLIPGAWHTGNTFEPVADILRAQGYKAETITLPSAGGPANITAHDDVEHIRKRYLNELVAQGREVILVMHSYAGIPGTESVKGFARKDLAAQDKQGGVVGLVYQAAFLVPAGASVESFLPGGLDPFMTLKVSDDLKIMIFVRREISNVSLRTAKCIPRIRGKASTTTWMMKPPRSISLQWFTIRRRSCVLP